MRRSPLGFRKGLNQLLARRRQQSLTLRTERANLESCEQALADAEAARKIAQEAAELVQNQAHAQIARVVSRCLSAVFEEPYELRVEFTRARGRTEARFVYLKGGNEVDPLLTSGGVLQLSALALRLVRLTLGVPRPDKALILDEPFNGVDARNLPRVAKLIEALSAEMGVQFVICTHERRLQTGKVVEL